MKRLTSACPAGLGAAVRPPYWEATAEPNTPPLRATVLNEHTTETSIAWSPDGTRIATIDEKGAVWLYDVKSSTRTRAQILSAGLRGMLAWHPSSSYLAVSGEQTMTFLDAVTDRLLHGSR